MTLNYEEYHALLTKNGEIDCSCHIVAPCPDCDDAVERYRDYTELGESR